MTEIASKTDERSTFSLVVRAVLLVEVVLPALLMGYGAFLPSVSYLEWGCRMALLSGFGLLLMVVFPWLFLGYAWRAIVILGLLVSLLVGLRGIHPDAPGAGRIALAIVTILLGACLWLIALYAILRGYFCPSDYAELQFPMRDGTYCCTAGGGSLWINHHNVPNQYYGLDFVKVNRWGKVADGFWPLSRRLSDYPTVGTDLYSPADGVILKVHDGTADLTPGMVPRINTAGNFILLRHGPYKILMGHLKQGSIQVHQGQQVTQGQLLAQLGNSGHSDFPHLHISVATEGAPTEPYDGKGAAARYDGRFLVRNSRISRPDRKGVEGLDAGDRSELTH